MALCGKNCSRWGMAFFATLTYGAVAVPILHEFHPSQVQDIVNHSESKLLFVGDKEWSSLQAEQMPGLVGALGRTREELEALYRRRCREDGQRSRVTTAAALCGAGLVIILLI